ncbi:cytochrome P450 [Nocardia sp. CNY236]|uniref:cytochrome P450 n=1 Tax=Nocardia sp. CNY236 TaxID=1169152 RepID=UPI00049087D9|nr:cytochrome P450 [Nocardia sp. CNY236]
MRSRYWFHWVSAQGIPRLVMRLQARRGDPFAELWGGHTGWAAPYPLIERLRAEGRLVHTPIAWATFDYELCRSMLRDSRFGVRPVGDYTAPEPLRSLAKRFPLPPSPVEPPSMLVIDPPEHTRMRRPVASAFTPRAIERLRDRVETVTDELLARLPTRCTVDLIQAFAVRVPIAIISQMLGFPDEDQARFLHWGDRMTPLLDIGIPWRTHRAALSAMDQMNDYLGSHIERLRLDPGEDILSSLVSGGELDSHALAATGSLLMGAGFETTVNLIGNGVVQLLAHPDQLQRLRNEPQLWPNAVEEILRFDPPVQTTTRTASADVEIGGVQLREGDTVIVSLAGANRDPGAFSDPLRFDIGRDNAREHLAFSSGVHSCLGARLARMEAGYALRALFERFPDLRLAGPLERRRLFTVHGCARMPVELGRRAPVPEPIPA